MSVVLTRDQRDQLEASAIRLEEQRSERRRRYFRPRDHAGYHKHLEFFAGSAQHRERLLLGGNRVGKTEAAAYEAVCHLTGDYPAWWTGRRFHGPIEMWAAGDTWTTVRDIIQVALLGKDGAHGTGMIPARLLEKTTPQAGVPGVCESIVVRRVTHAYDEPATFSRCQQKSYEQGRTAFQGTARHVIWLDEEPPEAIYGECLMRTMTVDGILIVTMTPLMGLTPFIQSYIETAVMEDGVAASTVYGQELKLE